MRLHPLVIDLDSLFQLRFKRFDNFLSSSPSRDQATPPCCRSSVPTTSEKSRMIRRQSLDVICACINGTKSFARRYARQQCTATVQREPVPCTELSRIATAGLCVVRSAGATASTTFTRDPRRAKKPSNRRQ